MVKKWWLRFKRYVLPYPLGLVGKFAMKLILSTCKIEVEGLKHLESLPEKKGILMLWHNRIAVMCEFFNRYLPEMHYAAFLSKSRDGEPIARIIKNYRGGISIRVSHSLRHQALKEAVAYLNSNQGLLLITPDGPKGPCYQVKPGIFFAARESGAPILPFTWESDHYWEFKTWDKFRLPKPFSSVRMIISAPLVLCPETSPELATEMLQEALRPAAQGRGR